ncbi:MAG TPA: lipoyl(octanoyl) transferase LipB [Phycisphaerales bacterium]|nr:lipoyl(octanoyl) transferase LipB [Phycisphaerales bacterium]
MQSIGWSARPSQEASAPGPRLGLIPYPEALARQQDLVQRRHEDRVPDTVLIVEHPPVITLGARATENRLLAEPGELEHRGIALVQVRRGGGTTAHNPGQIVFYPILKLKGLRLGVNEYIRSLESIGLALLQSVGLSAERRKGYPGLWIEGRKIASIGVQVKRWVTMHGMAINVNNDLSIFQAIVPCGIDGVRMTSVQNETGRSAGLPALKQRLGELCVNAWAGVRP